MESMKGTSILPEVAAQEANEGTQAIYLADLKALGYSDAEAQDALRELSKEELDTVTAPLREIRASRALADADERLYGKSSSVAKTLRGMATQIERRTIGKRGAYRRRPSKTPTILGGMKL